MNAEPVQRRLAAALVDRYRIEREHGTDGMATVYGMAAVYLVNDIATRAE